jgi:hypothetical protein
MGLNISRQALDQRNLSMVARGIDLFEDPVQISERLRQERIRKSLQRPRPTPRLSTRKSWWEIGNTYTSEGTTFTRIRKPIMSAAQFDAIANGGGRRHA